MKRIKKRFMGVGMTTNKLRLSCELFEGNTLLRSVMAKPKVNFMSEIRDRLQISFLRMNGFNRNN